MGSYTMTDIQKIVPGNDDGTPYLTVDFPGGQFYVDPKTAFWIFGSGIVMPGTLRTLKLLSAKFRIESK